MLGHRRDRVVYRVLWGLCLSLCLAPPISSEAATLWVARDGSGDFEIVADAVEAAASGDTIRIKAGVYPETREYQFAGGPLTVICRVQVEELTIIGDGADVVILGPEVPAAEIVNNQGPAGIIGPLGASDTMTLRGVTVRNLASGVRAQGGYVHVEDCTFTGTHWGVMTNVTGFATVRRCEFRSTLDRGVVMFRSLNAQGGLVEDCTFFECRNGVDLQPRNTQLRDCTFVGGGIGAQVSFGGDCIIQRCTFQDLWNGGLVISDGAQVQLFDSEFLGESPLNILVGGLLEGSGNLLGGGTVMTMRIFYPSTVRFHGNHILNGGGYTVHATSGLPPIRTMDLTGNFWGTQDPAQVAAWILDWEDASDSCCIDILFEPMADQPISTESTSMGELKARFRQE